MHNLLLTLALLLPVADHDDALHAIGQCPNGPNCPKPVRPQPKPEPSPEPLPHTPKPKPNANPLGLSDEEWQLCLVLGAVGAIALVVLGVNKSKADR